jgi:hypothetical protein
MCRSAAFSGRSQAGLAQQTAQSFAAQGEALDLAKPSTSQSFSQRW